MKNCLKKKAVGILLILALAAVFLPFTCGKTYADEEPDYLAFTAEEAGSSVAMKRIDAAGLQKPIALQYSTDKMNWVDYYIGFDNSDMVWIQLTNAGDTVYFRAGGENGINTGFSWDDNSCYYFMMEGKIAASGNVMSLLDRTCASTTVPKGAFSYLFSECEALTTAPSLPATTLAEGCYRSMFSGCTSLTAAPALPATTMAKECYYSMFVNCSSLTKAPALPATELAEGCYYTMFQGCTALTAAPELPATTMADCCYFGMFTGCTSLTAVPKLPATTLAEACYSSMFHNCKALKLYRESASEHSAAWMIPAEAAQTAAVSEEWNSEMFKGTSGDWTENPEPGTVYYQLSSASDEDQSGEQETSGNLTPKTGDTNSVWTWIAVMLACVAAPGTAIVFAGKSKTR